LCKLRETNVWLKDNVLGWKPCRGKANGGSATQARKKGGHSGAKTLGIGEVHRPNADNSPGGREKQNSRCK